MSSRGKETPFQINLLDPELMFKPLVDYERPSEAMLLSSWLRALIIAHVPGASPQSTDDTAPKGRICCQCSPFAPAAHWTVNTCLSYGLGPPSISPTPVMVALVFLPSLLVLEILFFSSYLCCFFAARRELSIAFEIYLRF